MDKALGLLCLSFQLVPSSLPYGLRTPIGADIGENLGTASQQLTEEHTSSVEGVVLGGQNIWLAGTFPVEGGIQQGLGEVTVGIEVRPLALSLESTGNGVVAQSLLLATNGQVLVAIEQVLDDAHHLHHKFPGLFLFLRCLLHFGRVLVESFLAMLLRPGQGLLEFLLIVDVLGHPADNFNLIHGLHPHSQILLEEVAVDDGAGNTHTNGTNLQV